MRPSSKSLSFLSAGFGLALGSMAAAQHAGEIPIPVINGDDMGVRVYNVQQFLSEASDQSVPVSYVDAQEIVPQEPRSLNDVDFIIHDRVSGTICDVKVLALVNDAERIPRPNVDCRHGDGAELAQLMGGEETPAQEYFDELRYSNTLLEPYPADYGRGVMEIINAEKDGFSFSLQRTWNFSTEGVEVCLKGQASMGERQLAASEVECHDAPVSEYLDSAVFAPNEDFLAPILFPGMFAPESF